MKNERSSPPSLWFAAAIGLLTACSPATGTAPPVDVVRPIKTVTVQAGVGDHVRVFPGRVEAASEVDIAFRVGGPLIKLGVEEGATVAAGQVLARIDPRDYRVRVRSAEARLRAANAQLNHATNEHARYRRLAKNDAIPRARLDDASAALEIASSERLAAERALEAAQLALRDTVLRAPFAGRVARRRVENHQTVRSGQPILLLQGRGLPEVHVDVAEGALRRFLAVQPTNLSVIFPTLDQTPHSVRVASHQGDIGRQTKTYEVVLALERAVAGLEPGMTATVRWVQPGDAQGMVIPLSAVGAHPTGEPIVYRVRRNVLERVDIQLGPITARGVEVRSGVNVGDVLLAAGVRSAAAGQQVRPLTREDLGG